jgi:hypothetical protein
MPMRVLRSPLVLLLVLVLGGGASAVCLAADLCMREQARHASHGADEASARSAELGCHASRAEDDPTALARARVAGGGTDDCCSLRAERLDAKTDSRDRLARWSEAPAASLEGSRLEARAEPTLLRVEGGARPGPRRPAFTLHAALLL